MTRLDKVRKAAGWKDKSVVSIPFKREKLSKAIFMGIFTKSGQVSIPFKREKLSKASEYRIVTATEMFQFPSNGKNYPKWNSMILNHLHKLYHVSIPFKREKLSKSRCFRKSECREIGSFNSLQTGKNYPRSLDDLFDPNKRFRFNSLQTGKTIQRQTGPTQRDYPNYKVSIPFKREKTIQRQQRCRWLGWRVFKVSIPFKREKLSKDDLTDGMYSWFFPMFQFPSNGKNYPKLGKGACGCVSVLTVSIPFKRENLSKGESSQRANDPKVISFNSLQTGKPIQSTIPQYRQQRGTIRFQFPSNGKTYPKIKYDRYSLH